MLRWTAITLHRHYYDLHDSSSRFVTVSLNGQRHITNITIFYLTRLDRNDCDGSFIALPRREHFVHMINNVHTL